MLAVHCDVHGSTVLLWPRNIDTIDNTPHGPVLHWRCHCGHRGTWSPRQAEPAGSTT